MSMFISSGNKKEYIYLENVYQKMQNSPNKPWTGFLNTLKGGKISVEFFQKFNLS
jgi:hypothetical protein